MSQERLCFHIDLVTAPNLRCLIPQKVISHSHDFSTEGPQEAFLQGQGSPPTALPSCSCAGWSAHPRTFHDGEMKTAETVGSLCQFPEPPPTLPSFFPSHAIIIKFLIFLYGLSELEMLNSSLFSRANSDTGGVWLLFSPIWHLTISNSHGERGEYLRSGGTPKVTAVRMKEH